MDGNELLSEVPGKYGAPMGRRSYCENPAVTVTLFRVRMVDGDYDSGGAYWGDSGKPLYAAIGDGFEWYCRAGDIESARNTLSAEYPELTIELPEVDPDFLDGYLTAALWSSTDDAGEPLDNNYQQCDISPEFLSTAAEDCRKFLDSCRELIEGNCLKSSGYSEMELAGHDFWLTRNRHGAGFWDGDWECGEELTEACRKFPEIDLYVGDDWKIYC